MPTSTPTLRQIAPDADVHPVAIAAQCRSGAVPAPDPTTALAGADPSPAIPRHMALIMDGNGRWATRRGQERIVGHEAGELAIVAAIDAALEAGVRWLTLFAFSTENWNRPLGEVDFLMEFNRRLIEKYGEAYYRRGVRFRYMGERTAPVPAAVAEAMTRIERATADARALTLTFAFNYGGRLGIIRACQRLIAEGIAPEAVDEARFAAARQYPDAPDPDVIVRTAGEYRLSNFLLWEAAYAELMFLDMPWPDFRGQHFQLVLRTYAERTRTFGAVTASAVAEPPAASDGGDPAGPPAGGASAGDPALALPARMPALPPLRGAAGRRHRAAARAARRQPGTPPSGQDGRVALLLRLLRDGRGA